MLRQSLKKVDFLRKCWYKSGHNQGNANYYDTNNEEIQFKWYEQETWPRSDVRPGWRRRTGYWRHL